MLIRNVELSDLDSALASVNAVFADNVKFRRCDHVSKSRGGGQTFRVTLTVKDSSMPGARRSVGHNAGRRISAACWHIYGVYMDTLPEGAHSVVSGQAVKQPGDPWVDCNIGSRMYPAMYSDTCECDHGPNEVDYLPHPIGGTSW